MKNIKPRLTTFFLLMLAITPVIWFIGKKGLLINGVDTNFPLNPATWFYRRFFVWQSISNAGSDFSSSTAGTFFHLIQFLPFKLGFSLQGVEIFSLIFWFATIVLGSWVLARLLFTKKPIIQIIFVCLYSLNIYLFNSFENVKVANLSLVASIPLALSVLILLRRKEITRIKAGLLSVGVGLIVGGTGINPAYIVSFFLVIFIFFISEVLANLGNKKSLFNLIKDFCVVTFVIVVVNLFWILPTLNFIFSSVSSSNSIGSIGFSNWIDSLSQNTSLVNVVRIQGAWDWYIFDSMTNLPVYIPYATRYFFNPFFIGFSFLISACAFCAFILRKRVPNELYIFFGILFIVGSFLTAGTHPPSGVVFSFFAKYIPFFTLFRSPWYIFAPLVGLSIAGLTGIFFSNISDKFPRNKLVDIVSIFFIVGCLVYSYPILLGKIFRPNFPGGFYIKFPDYVFQTEKWLASTNLNGRILSYPDDEIKDFTWGYRGVDSILSLFSDKEIVHATLNDASSPFSQIVFNLYDSIKRDQIYEARSIAYTLGIGNIFEKSDQISSSPSLPSQITNKKIASFGSWNFYKFVDNPLPKIFPVDSAIRNFPDGDSSKNLGLLDKKQVLINPQDSLLKMFKLDSYLGNIIRSQNSQLNALRNSNLIPISRFQARDLSSVVFDFKVVNDGYYEPILDVDSLDSYGIINQSRLNVTVDGYNDSWQVARRNDSFIYFSPVNFSKGSHNIVLSIKNLNIFDGVVPVKMGDGTFDFSNGNYSISNQSDRDISLDFPISQFDSSSSYLISFKYKQLVGNSVFALIEQTRNGGQFPINSQTEHLPNSPDWQDFSFYFNPINTDSSLKVRFKVPAVSKDFSARIVFSNVQMYKVFTNSLFFLQNPSNKLILPNITFKEISPVSYSGDVSDGMSPHIIIFNENYSKDWQISLIGAPSARIFHFTANSYANGWYIENANYDYKFNIYYGPQKFLNVGYIIAIVVVISVFLAFVFLRKKK